jgi:CarD family transcriptional regulator
MFNKGDRIVYPLYGAGVIDNIETKEIDGRLHTYYVLLIPVGNLKIMISAGKAEALRVRPVHTADELHAHLTAAAAEEAHIHDSWNQRYKENMDRIKSGELYQVAAVYYALITRERERGLSTAEKKMATTAKQIILSELVLVLGFDKEKAEEKLDEYF